MDLMETLDKWNEGLHIFHRAHSRAASLNEARNVRLGVPTVILAAVVGTAVFTSLAGSPGIALTIITGLLSVAAAVLAALQTFLRYSELTAKHKAAAQSYGVLRRELEEALAESRRTTPPTPPSSDFVKAFRQRWDAADKEAPALPQGLYDGVEKQIRGGTSPFATPNAAHA